MLRMPPPPPRAEEAAPAPGQSLSLSVWGPRPWRSSPTPRLPRYTASPLGQIVSQLSLQSREGAVALRRPHHTAWSPQEAADWL